MQTEQITTRYFKDGKIQMIDKDVWDSWTFGNPEQKVANELTTVPIPDELKDKFVRFNGHTLLWEDASEDAINQVKTSFDKFKKDAEKSTTQSKEDREQMQKTIDGLSTNNSELRQRVEELQQTIAEMAQGGNE